VFKLRLVGLAEFENSLIVDRVEHGLGVDFRNFLKVFSLLEFRFIKLMLEVSRVKVLLKVGIILCRVEEMG
jgi:hypothetical protein